MWKKARLTNLFEVKKKEMLHFDDDSNVHLSSQIMAKIILAFT
jgi:hypothetical protein